MRSWIYPLAMAALLLPPPLLAQDRPAIVVWGGAVSPGSFGRQNLVVDFPPGKGPEGPTRVVREGELGPAASVGVVIPYLGDVSLEAAYTYVAFESATRLVLESTGEKLGAGGVPDRTHRAHVYRAGVRYAVPLSAPVRPHLSVALGGITVRTERDADPTGETISETTGVVVLGAGITIPAGSRFRVRFDVEDYVHTCEGGGALCELEDETIHDFAFQAGVEIGL